jgi:hypothetical protein
MPQVSGDRFSSQNMSDCAFCPADGRRFRTTRQCSACGKALCLVCRPALPGTAFVCPDCGGGEAEYALLRPQLVIERLTAAGVTVPFWLSVAVEQISTHPTESVEELIVPE